MSQPSHSASPPTLFQQGRQPITPPPTPPRRHLYPPRYLSHDPSLAPPSPSPSISSSTLSSTRSNRQTEWIYRRPKALNSSSGSNISMGTSLLSRHRSASINAGQRQSATASCSPQQVSRSPSSCHTATAATCHNLTSTSSSPANSSSKSQPPTAKPRPSSPVFISSTIQFVDVGTPPASPSGLERNPSICSNLTSRSHGGVYGFASLATSPMSNSTHSNLQLQSLIRVSPLKNRHHGGGGGGNNSPMTDSGSSLMTGNQVAERRHSPTTTGATLPSTQSPSATSSMINRRAGKSMWSAPHSGLGATISPSLTPVLPTGHFENDRILKSIPSQTQISVDSSITPTFVVPSSTASLPLFVPLSNSVYHLKNAKHASEKLSLRTPTGIRHSLSATSTSRTSPSSHPQREWRDKFASSPSLPISFVGANKHQGDASPTVPHLGMKMSPLLLSSSSPPPPLAAENRRRRRRSSSSSSNNTNQNPSKSRDRISSFTSQTSIATATTARTSMTNRTLSSCSTTSSLVNSQCTPITPVPQDPSDLTSKPIPVPGAHYFRRSSSNSTGYTPASYHLHGHGREKKFLLNQSYQRRYQRQGSTTSSVSFDGVGESGNNAAASARSQAYAQLTGNATAAGMGLGLGTIANANVDAGSRSRRPSTSPGSGFGPSTNSSPCGQRHGSGQGRPASGSTTCGTITTMLSPSSPPTYQPHSRLAHSSLISLSHYGNPSSITRTPSRVTSPPYVPSHHFSSLPKTRSILTRASSLSTKASACGSTVKSVKFVEIPEIYYRSGYYEHDGIDFIYGCDTGNTDAKEEEDRGDEGQDDIPAVGARGEGQEGMVLRECSGMDIEAIDMDIDTYLGTQKHFAEESKETKYGLKKMGWGFLSRGRRLIEKESRREQEDGMKASIVPLPPFSDQEQRREEKEKTTPGFGLRRLMGLTTRKAPPPPLSLSISSSAPLSPESPNALIRLEEDKIQPKNNKKPSTSPSVSPRKPISGPYVLGSHLPSRSPSSTHSSMPSPSSPLHQPIPSRSILASSSSTSLNKMHGRPWCGHSPNSPIPSSASVCQGHHHRSRSLRSTHAPNASIVTTIFSHLDSGMNTERPVGPNVAGRMRPKGIVMGADAFQSVNSLIKNASSYESFRSAKSCGGRSDDVDSMKSVGAGSMRTFRAWMNKIGTGGGGGVECVAVGRE